VSTRIAAAAAPQGYAAALTGYVGAKVLRLQGGYLDRGRGDHSTAAGALARLRRAVATEPGTEPGIWDLLFEGFPQELVGRGEEPSRAERSAHAALTLYAVHQQSQKSGMHVVGRSLGTACGLLARNLAAGREVGADPGAVRRFQALGTSTSFSETLYHARGLVMQLRGAQIAVDYGRLAADLYRLQHPARSDTVRLQWGRDFYSIGPETSTDTAAGGTSESNDTEKETS